MEILPSWVLRHLNQQSPRLRRWKPHILWLCYRYNNDSRHCTSTPWCCTCASWLWGSGTIHRLLAPGTYQSPTVPWPFSVSSPQPGLHWASRHSFRPAASDGRLNNVRKVKGHSPLLYFLCSEVGSLFGSNVCEHQAVVGTSELAVPLQMVVLLEAQWAGKALQRRWINFKSEPLIPSSRVFPQAGFQSSYEVVQDPPEKS